jgi:hypothetical protein
MVFLSLKCVLDWSRLSIADRLRLLAFDSELRRLPRPLIDAIWAGIDALATNQGPS